MVDSTSDERTVNNVMRHEYRVLTESEKAIMQAVKDAGLRFILTMDRLGHGPAAEMPKSAREFALAKTKMEEAVMWAVKGITK